MTLQLFCQVLALVLLFIAAFPLTPEPYHTRTFPAGMFFWLLSIVMPH